MQNPNLISLSKHILNIHTANSNIFIYQSIHFLKTHFLVLLLLKMLDYFFLHIYAQFHLQFCLIVFHMNFHYNLFQINDIYKLSDRIASFKKCLKDPLSIFHNIFHLKDIHRMFPSHFIL